MAKMGENAKIQAEQFSKRNDRPVSSIVKKLKLFKDVGEDRPPVTRHLVQSMVELSSSKLGRPLSPQEIENVEACICRVFPVLRTPQHPSYSEMIYKVIETVNEEGGCSKVCLSAYIKDMYSDLPWAHESILCHQLHKLTERGELVVTENGGYSLPQKENHTLCWGNICDAANRVDSLVESLSIVSYNHAEATKKEILSKQEELLSDGLELFQLEYKPEEGEKKPVKRRGKGRKKLKKVALEQKPKRGRRTRKFQT